MTRRITTTHAYHPASQELDLELPVGVVQHYQVALPLIPQGPVSPDLDASIRASGVLTPVHIYTDGVFAVLKDGHHRLQSAILQGLATIPVQVIPDSMKRETNQVALEPELAAWVETNLWAHEDHDVDRRVIGQRQGGTLGNSYMICVCSCGAGWKEEN